VKPKSTDDDDGPTYVIEESNEVISKEEYDRLVKDDTEQQPAEKGSSEYTNPEQPTAETGAALDEKADGHKPQQSVAGIGGGKKRKQAKVVSDETSGEQGPADRAPKPTTKKPKQKKRIKLSFEED
jgi:hypothetical protein